MKTRILLFLSILFISPLSAQTFPPGFSQVKVASILQATAMDFAPDGRIFVCQRDGNVKIIKNGVLLSTPFVKLTTDQNGERGISGITFDPNFSTNHYVYIYYTATTPTIHNRLSRFTANGDVAVAGSEVQLLNAETVTAVFHNGGGIGFGPDGKLYLAMGEDNKPSNAQSLTTYKGKLLRLNPDGSPAPGNPYSSSTNEITKKIWCLGLRNPYTMCFHPTSGRIFINNVGADNYEEIHDGTSSGQNFGWPAVEGYGTDPAYVNPIFAYPHESTGLHGCAITGGAFFNPASTTYPTSYTGKYFYMDYCNGWIWYLTPTATSYTGNTVFATGLTTKNLALQLGTDGNLYYLNRDDAKAGVYKIIYTTNNPPAISSQPANVTVPAGQPASFSVSATGAMPLSYQWRKNGTNISGATASTYTIASTTASDAAQYSVRVTNAYGTATSNNATLTVTGANARPDAVILTPANNANYRAGDVISFSGNATDAEDGTLPASAFEWETEFHHNTHFHPGPFIPAGIKSGTFQIPNTGESSPNVFYRLRLRVTDSNGLVDTPYIDLLPLKSMITLNTVPAGLQVTYDGQPKTAVFSTQAVRGMTIPIGVISPQTKSGITYTFSHWQQGGTASHNINIGNGDSTYVAVFTQSAASCTSSGTILREKWINIGGTSVSNIPQSASPSSTDQLTIFEAPKNIGDDYGQRIRGYICAPATGNYVFWISSDNNSELWLSTNDDPANKVKIASVSGYTASREWTKYPSQRSAAISLTAGQRYYIEALHKEASQSDNIAVGWQLPNGTQERPIPGSRLSPYTSGSAAPTVYISEPSEGYSHSSPANITIKASASSPNGLSKVEFYADGSKIGEDATAPYSFTWMNVTTGTYELHAKAIDLNSVATLSEPVHVTVTTCITPVITPAGPTTMCSGSVLLKANTGTGFSYQWKKNGTDISGATASTYTASSSGDYQVKIIQGSCISWSAPTKVRIESGLRAAITPGGPTTFCEGGSVKLYANTCSGYTYQWRKNGVNIPGATGAQYTASTSANFQVMVTLNGASAWSSQIAVTVENCRTNENEEDEEELPVTIMEKSDSTFQMKVYPNPNNGLFTIIVSTPIAPEEKISLRIVNVLGQEVYHKEGTAGGDHFRETVELDSSLKVGVYTLQMTIGTKVESTSIVLSK